MRSTCANHVLLSRTILYIGHVIWFCSISLLQLCFMPSQAWVHITLAMNSWNTNWKIILTLVSYCGCIKWPNCYKVNRSPQYLDWMMARLLLNPSELFSPCLPICPWLCKCPTTSILITNLGLNKLWNLNSRSCSPTGQISVNGI